MTRTGRLLAAVALSLMSSAAMAQSMQISSKDGTAIAYECAGTGPELLIVHGGAGDRTRWTPMFAHLADRFTVCAMDRRAHGQSGDGPAYSLQREAEDVAAVAKARGKRVTVLGHSFGGVVAYEAAFLTRRIERLILYEPPMQVTGHEPILARMDGLLAAGNGDEAMAVFMREIVQISQSEVEAMRKRPQWQAMVAGAKRSIEQDRALATYRWDARRAAKLRRPVLLLLGERTKSADLRGAIEQLSKALPDDRVVTLAGQEHNAMDTGREALAAEIKRFALEPER
ncbi:alpha/beta fold hydrolase [Tsuneonella sp. HG094]